MEKWSGGVGVGLHCKGQPRDTRASISRSQLQQQRRPLSTHTPSHTHTKHTCDRQNMEQLMFPLRREETPTLEASQQAGENVYLSQSKKTFKHGLSLPH